MTRVTGSLPSSPGLSAAVIAGHDRVVTHSAPLDPSPAERVGRVARRERKRTACRVGVQEKVPTLASLRFGLPSPLLAHARGGGMGTTGAVIR